MWMMQEENMEPGTVCEVESLEMKLTINCGPEHWPPGTSFIVGLHLLLSEDTQVDYFTTEFQIRGRGSGSRKKN